MPKPLDRKLLDEYFFNFERSRDGILKSQILIGVSELPLALETFIREECDHLTLGISALNITNAGMISIDHPLMQPGLQSLNSIIGPGNYGTEDGLKRALRGSYLADLFIFSSGLSTGQRAANRVDQTGTPEPGKMRKLYNEAIVAVEGQNYERIEDEAQTLKENLARLKDFLGSYTEGLDHLKLPVQKVITSVLESLHSPAYKLFRKYCPSDKNWVWNLLSDIVGNYATTFEGIEKFRNGELKDLPLEAQLVFFLASVGVYGESEMITADNGKRRSVDRFLKSPDLHLPFWGYFTSIPYEYIRYVDEKGDSGGSQFNIDNYPPYPLFECLFQNVPSILAGFLDTFKGKELDRKSMNKLARRVLGMAGLFKRTDGHQLSPEAVQTLSAFLAKHNQSIPLDDEFKILTDKEPGILYFNVNQELKAKSISPGQSKDELTKQVLETGGVTVYESNAEIEQGPTKKTAIENKHVIELSGGDVEVAGFWGEVFVPKPEDVPGIISQLNKRLPRIDQDPYRVLEAYQAKALRTGGVGTVLPGILPVKDPLRELSRIGVVAIGAGSEAMSEAKLVRVVLDSETAGIISGSSQRLLVLEGKLDDSNLLVLDGTTDEEVFSPAHLLINAAAALGRADKTDNAFTKEEVSAIRAVLKDWKETAQRLGLPPLKFDPDSRTIKPREKYVFYPVGKKTARLGFNGV